MKIPIWQVDAFSSRVFGGNPAAVCVLDEWLTDGQLRNIAAENNLAETAFLRREEGNWRIRWFTPTVEVDLCGHATLAAAFVLFSEGLAGKEELVFDSLSGPLRVLARESRLVLDFPARPPRAEKTSPEVARALGIEPVEVLRSRDLIAVLSSEQQVRALRPDFARLAELDCFAVCVTAAGAEKGVDFVSRFFAPRQGINEDPVTGSAHCSLAPYWAGRLGRQELAARQVSDRGGELFCRLAGERVEIAGEAALYLRGEIHWPES